MKALILAAGFGTRLLPYTRKLPKPLFTLLSIPMLAYAIENLIDAGCEQIFINTHHLSDQIHTFINQKKYSAAIQTIHEPVLLDTGGAIANAKPFLKDSSFFVINADIISTIDLKKVYQFHRESNCLATLVLHDHEKFNKVCIDEQGYIKQFDSKTKGLAFTGIQVLSPQIYEFFPDKKIFSSIQVYQDLCPKNQIKAFVEKKIFWSDIGTKDDYSMTSLQILAASQFGIKRQRIKQIQIERLAGDGSDRIWYRVKYKNKSFIISDHGICLAESDRLLQLKAFVHIGKHLYSRGIPVPLLFNHDRVSGMVILQDLGDIHLETIIKQTHDKALILKLYQKVIALLIDFSVKGLQGFNREWTCQTKTYSRELIVEKECRYFMEAFIQNYLKRTICFADFSAEFDFIAGQAVQYGFSGLMHRDLQSRNIMIHNDQIYFIDFQSARVGPLQYDLASLLIDPYVKIDEQIKNRLLYDTMEKLKLNPGQSQDFLKGYRYCCLTRNLQFLGAFSFLSQEKQKRKFEDYIPDAMGSLKKIVTALKTDKIPKLSKLISTL